MIERILVPLDGSATAEAILPQVRRLLLREDAEVIFLRSENPIGIESPAPVAEAALAAAREYIIGIQERFIREGARARARAELGPAADVILDAARQERAGLIAMATHGRTGVARLLLGSVAEAVLRRSAVPVFALRPFWSYEIAPGGRPERRPVKRILVPLDGSAASRAILPHAAEFARLFDSSLYLLHVLPPDPKADRDLGGRELANAAAELRSHGLEAATLVDVGDPAAKIQEACGLHDIDLIAMATHGRSGVSRLVAGSVTEQVLRNAKAPLMIISAKASEASPPRVATEKETK